MNSAKGWAAATLLFSGLMAVSACAVATPTSHASGPDPGVDGALEDVVADAGPESGPASNGDASLDGSAASSAADSDAPSPSAGDAFSATCGTCAAGQKCASGHGGEYCVAPCPGQPCPPSGPQVPYCDAYGGVHCLAS
jgi:hypothetical protein